MTREDLELLERSVMAQVVKRRALGGYSVEAEGVLALFEAMLHVVQHLKSKTPRTKKSEDDL